MTLNPEIATGLMIGTTFLIVWVPYVLLARRLLSRKGWPALLSIAAVCAVTLCMGIVEEIWLRRAFGMPQGGGATPLTMVWALCFLLIEVWAAFRIAGYQRVAMDAAGHGGKSRAD